MTRAMLRRFASMGVFGMVLVFSAGLGAGKATGQSAGGGAVTASATRPARGASTRPAAAAPAGALLLWAWVDAPDANAANAAARQLVTAGADVDSAVAWLRAGRPGRKVAKRDSPWETFQVRGADGKKRTHVLRVPASFDGYDQRHPLVVELHGGVSYPKPRPTEQMRETDYAFGGGLMDKAFYLQPKGTSQAMWFDPVGSDNVLKGIREVCRRYPIDTNRIYLGGFSDGGHGAYYFSAAHPTPFAGFLPLNGFPLLAQSKGLQMHLRNMTNKPMYVVATGKDFYPLNVIQATVDMLKKLGAPLEYRLYKQMPHAPLYLTEDNELPRITRWLKRTVREPYPRELVWETADLQRLAGLHWLRIERIGQVGNNHPFPDVNATAGGGRVRLGIHVDADFQGKGVRVERLAETYIAKAIGIRPGDVIVGIDAKPIATREDLQKILAGKSHDDPIRVTVARRGGKSLTLIGRFPPDNRRRAFPRSQPYGSIRARRSGNRFDVRVQNVEVFKLLLGPEMVNFAEPVTVTVNGETVFEKKVTPSLATALRWARRLADPAQVYTAELSIEVPPAEPTADRFED